MALAQKGDKPKALKELQQALRSSPAKDEENKIRDLINKLQAPELLPCELRYDGYPEACQWFCRM